MTGLGTVELLSSDKFARSTADNFDFYWNSTTK